MCSLGNLHMSSLGRLGCKTSEESNKSRQVPGPPPSSPLSVAPSLILGSLRPLRLHFTGHWLGVVVLQIIRNMTRGRLALLAALCLLISMVALHVEARPLPDDCGPLGKHRYRCGGPPRITRSVQVNPKQLPDCGPLGKHRYRYGGPPRITRSVQANPDQLSPTDIHEASSIHAPPASAHELKKVIATSSTSGAAQDGVAGETPSIAEDPECGPLEKNHFRCGNPPRIRVRDINALG